MTLKDRLLGSRCRGCRKRGFHLSDGPYGPKTLCGACLIDFLHSALKAKALLNLRELCANCRYELSFILGDMGRPKLTLIKQCLSHLRHDLEDRVV